MVALVRHQDHLYDSHTFVSTSGPKMFVIASPRIESDHILFHGMTLGGWRWAELDHAGHITLTAPPPNQAAWLVETKGRHALWAHRAESQASVQVSSSDLDVYDVSAEPGLPLVFAAMDRDQSLKLYEADDKLSAHPFNIANARFPALSPDQHWLAYSSLEKGTWRLTVRNLASGAEQRIGIAECNDASPVWDSTSQTLTYVSDCGRGLWQTALATAKVAR
jgi:hypothetical protein